MNIFFGILIGFIVLTTLVVLHELGHFLTAKKNGVKVNEFGIGFPPRAIAWIHIPASQVEEYLENLSEAGKKSRSNKLWMSEQFGNFKEVFQGSETYG